MTRILALIIIGLVIQSPISAQSRQADPQRCDRTTLRLALDIGHTPEQTGALSARGVEEFEFNRKLAETVKELLRAEGFTQTYTIEAKGKGRVQLLNRVAQVNRTKPDFLLSIHHDDTQRQFHKKWVVNNRELEFTDHASGHSIFVSRENKHFTKSYLFAKAIGEALRGAGLQYSSHHAEDVDGERRKLIDKELGIYQYDALVVLKDSRVPAVLIEAGVITNRDDELVLASTEGKQRIAKSILDATRAICLQKDTR